MWDVPGSGSWSHDPSHNPFPTSTFLRSVGTPGLDEGKAAGWARYGWPLLATRRAYVNGFLYEQQLAVDQTELNERDDAARRAYVERSWRADAKRWFDVLRPAVTDACLTMQAVEPAGLTDRRLFNHLDRCMLLQRRLQRIHFTNSAMTFVVGKWLLAASEWSVPAHVAMATLAGASPATAESIGYVDAIVDALRQAGTSDTPTTLDAVRAASESSASALADYLRHHGWRVVGGFGYDSAALAELPELVLQSIAARFVGEALSSDASAHAIDESRALVPASAHGRFDELLADARLVYGIRDDDVGPCMWARGLVRRGLLAVGERLIQRGLLAERDDVFELTYADVGSLLVYGHGPTLDAVTERVALRRQQAQLVPPATIDGEDGGEVVEPTALWRAPHVALVACAAAAYRSIGTAPTSAPRTGQGIGIGDRSYRGIARVARNPEEAFAKLSPGDVLVTTITTPSFNVVLPVVGALVVEHGGLMSHAGIIAREFGIPTVVAASGCMASIPDGAEVEVDPVQGCVRVVAPPASE